MEIKNRKIRGLWKRVKDPVSYIKNYKTITDVKVDKILQNTKELFERLKKKS